MIRFAASNTSPSFFRPYQDSFVFVISKTQR
jgi:hypothetical protein